MNLHDKGLTTEQSSASRDSDGSCKRTLHNSYLLRNSFAVLGATVRDDRRRIVELAEEKALELEDEVCQKARSELTHPRMRLAAEVGWLPGVSPSRAKELISKLHSDAMVIRSELDLPPLARANLLAESFEAIYPTDSADYVAELIEEMAACVEELSAEKILSDINEDRTISGFPEVQSVEVIEAELAGRQRYYRSSIREALDRLPTSRLVDVMTEVVDSMTHGGIEHAPELVDELVDRYEVEADPFLQAEAENIKQLCQILRNTAPAGVDTINPIIDKLQEVVRNWRKVAKPIQLSAKARGIENNLNEQIAFTLGKLVVDLHEQYRMLDQSQRLTELLSESFAESTVVHEVHEWREESVAKNEEWAREISYQVAIGGIFKENLSISPEGIVWRHHRFTLDRITNISWGGIRANFGATYFVRFGDGHTVAEVKIKKTAIYQAIIDKLWKAVGVRLLLELLETVRSGSTARFGDVSVTDEGVMLSIRSRLRISRQINCNWDEVQVWSAGGIFFIGDKHDKKAYVGLSYLDDMNTHVLEQAVRMVLKKPGVVKLSDMLR